MMNRNTPTASLGINYVIDTLQLLKEERTASTMYSLMLMRFKKTQLKILRWLVQDQLASKRLDYVILSSNHHKQKPRSRPHVYYRITGKGRFFLRLCQHFPLFFPLS